MFQEIKDEAYLKGRIAALEEMRECLLKCNLTHLDWLSNEEWKDRVNKTIDLMEEE